MVNLQELFNICENMLMKMNFKELVAVIRQWWTKLGNDLLLSICRL